MLRRNFLRSLLTIPLAPVAAKLLPIKSIPTRPVFDELNTTTLITIYPKVIRDQFFKNTPLLVYVRASANEHVVWYHDEVPFKMIS